jgi:twitching motility two-component system response regulator PilH
VAGIKVFKRLFAGATAGDRREASREGMPRGATVLVVDDSSTIRAVLGKMLAQDGHVVLKAPDGPSAIELARSDLPDLIFLDIVLPGMNGFAVLRALRRDPLTQAIPIVMISGNLQATEQFYVQRFGADDFMKKPFGRVEVFARIQHLAQTGRLVVRERLGEAPPVVFDEAEHAAIPDIAMPDPQDLLVPELEQP